MQYEENARRLFCDGFNCAQSVFAAFCPLTGIEQKTALRIAAPFGGGIGKMREVCGAVSGMLMALGALYGYDHLADKEARPKHYAQVQSLIKQFLAQHQCLLCRDLLAKQQACGQCANTDRAHDPCGGYVATAAKLIEKFIEANPL